MRASIVRYWPYVFLRCIPGAFFRVQKLNLQELSQRGYVSSGMAQSRKGIKDNGTAAKYCATCGRVISSNHRNFDERKYCSKSCSTTKVTSLDRELEGAFVSRAISNGHVSCDEVQRQFEAEGKGPNPSPDDKQRAGLETAKWRERVRRAGRRVVVFPHDSDDTFQCVQQGKAIEPSFAKGDWEVRHMKRAPV